MRGQKGEPSTELTFYRCFTQWSGLSRFQPPLGLFVSDTKTLTLAGLALLLGCFHFASTDLRLITLKVNAMFPIYIPPSPSQMPSAQLGTAGTLKEDKGTSFHLKAVFMPSFLPSCPCLFGPGWVRRPAMSRKSRDREGYRRATPDVASILKWKIKAKKKKKALEKEELPPLLPSSFICQNVT